jgi:PAS domain S-box-containing protein
MSKTDLQILLLEDESLDVDLIKAHLLLLEEYNCIVQWVQNRRTYLDALENNCFEIVLSDFNLPDYTGLDALNALKAKKIIIPFIFVTGTLNGETAASAIKAGAWDYVVKDRLFRLPLAIRSALQLKEEKIINARTEAQNRKLLLAIDQSPSHITIYDINGNIEYVNARFTEVTGFLPEDVLGKNIFNVLKEKDNENEIKEIWENLKNGIPWRGEMPSHKKNGTVYWEHLSISPVKNENNAITHFVTVNEDITQRKKMEKELLDALARAEKSDQLKEAFLQNLSHEIRTPLNAVVGFSNLLDSTEEYTPDTIKDYTTIIRNSSNQLLSIVSDILTIARIQTGQETVTLKHVNISTLLNDLCIIFKPQAEKKSLEFILDLPSVSEQVYTKTDETKLNQILTNLINNAIKFTHQGFVKLSYTLSNSNIEFSVQDTGIGIAIEHQEIIFERFRQAKTTISSHYGGTGLGLSISQSFARLLEGKIRVESEVNQGSKFYLTLPYVPKENAQAELIPKAITLINTPITLLVAEDEETNYLLIEAYLANSNITMYHARNGKEAITICKENPEINLILMDIKMPVMDGEQAFREIRKIRESIPVIAQTAYALEADKQRFLEIGFTDYLAKPIKQEELMGKINKIFQLNR